MSETQSQERNFAFDGFVVDLCKCPMSHAFGVIDAKEKHNNMIMVRKLISRYDSMFYSKYDANSKTGNVISESQARDVWGELMNEIYGKDGNIVYDDKMYDVAYDIASELGWLDEIEPPFP
jgi:hypothetical protein